MRFVRWLGCVLALGVAGCGGGDDDGNDGNDGTTQKFACDIGASSEMHACYEWSWNGPATAADPYTGVCTSSGATTVTTCPAAGKVGGCKYTVTSGSVTVTWTNWFYFGTATNDMMGCVSSGQLMAVWVNP